MFRSDFGHFQLFELYLNRTMGRCPKSKRVWISDVVCKYKKKHLQWNAEIRILSDFRQMALVREQIVRTSEIRTNRTLFLDTRALAQTILYIKFVYYYIKQSRLVKLVPTSEIQTAFKCPKSERSIVRISAFSRFWHSTVYKTVQLSEKCTKSERSVWLV